MKENKIIGIILLVFSGFAYLCSTKIPEKAATFPKVLIYLIATFSILLMITSFLKKEEYKLLPAVFNLDSNKKYKLLCIIFCTLTYIVLIPILGYFFTTFMFVSASPMALGKQIKKNYYIIPISLIIVIILFLVFKAWLNLFMPQGLIF